MSGYKLDCTLLVFCNICMLSMHTNYYYFQAACIILHGMFSVFLYYIPVLVGCDSSDADAAVLGRQDQHHCCTQAVKRRHFSATKR